MEPILFDNFLIRHVHLSDVTDYFNLVDRNRNRLKAFFPVTVALTPDIPSTRKHLEEVIAKNEENNHFLFVIIENNSEKMIGSIQVKNLDWNIPKAELGYFIDKDFEGRGIMSKAVSKIVHFAFHDLKLAKVYIRANHVNAGSIKVAEKNGFEAEGILRKDHKTTEGKLVDLIYFGLLNPDL